MRFVVRMAVRELRASWRRLAFFFVCVAIGGGIGAKAVMSINIFTLRQGQCTSPISKKQGNGQTDCSGQAFHREQHLYFSRYGVYVMKSDRS